jgi:hypothetical protein
VLAQVTSGDVPLPATLTDVVAEPTYEELETVVTAVEARLA